MRARLLSWLLAIGMTGCSFIAVDGPPPNYARLNYFDCTSSGTWPVLDGIFSGLMVINAIGTAAGGNSYVHSDTERNEVIGANIGLAVLTGASMVYGIVKVGQCRDAKAELGERLNGPGRMVRPIPVLPPPPPPPPEPPPPPPQPAGAPVEPPPPPPADPQ